MATIPKPILHLGLYLYTNAVDDIAEAVGLNEDSKTALLLEMASAIRAGELQVRDPKTGGPFLVTSSMDNPSPYVTIQDINTWLSMKGYPYRWTADALSSITSAGVSISTKQNNVFRNMKKLAADELTITFVGDKPESGMGNNMLEISARGETRRVPLAEIGLVDRRSGTLNSQGAILLGMTQKNKLAGKNTNSAKIIRLRKALQTYLGVSSNLFSPYNKSDGWTPIFKLEDKRGAADERAKLEAELRTASWDQKIECGERAATDYHTNDEMDDADLFLKETDPSYQR